MSNEPEQYSIDEIMARLKSQGQASIESEGELVTRADGTQAIRVKRRKRRSHQPKKEKEKANQRARTIQLLAAMGLVTLAALICGFAVMYANSPPFRDGLSGKIARVTGAQTELTQFRMNPSAANLAALSLKWPEGNAIESITLRNVAAKISPASFLGRKFLGEEIVAADGTINVRAPLNDQPSRFHDAGEPGDLIEFDRYAAPSVTLNYGDPIRPDIRFSKSEAAYYPKNSKGSPQVTLTRGQVMLAGWPKLELDRANFVFHGADIEVSSLRLRTENDDMGSISLAGMLAPYALGNVSKLQVVLDAMPLTGLAGAELGGILRGRIESLPAPREGGFEIMAGSKPEMALEIPFQGSLGEPLALSGLPFLTDFRGLLDDIWYETPLFETHAKGVLRRAGGNVSLSDLELTSKGRLAIRGSLAFVDGTTYAGELKVGLSEAVISSTRNARLDELLSAPVDGFRWIDLKISGPKDAPKDDFRERYESMALEEPVGIDAEASGLPSFEDLTKPR